MPPLPERPTDPPAVQPPDADQLIADQYADRPGLG